MADVLRIQKSLQAEIKGQARPENQHHERGKQGPRKKRFPKPEGVFLVCSFLGDAQAHQQESRRDQVGSAFQRLRQQDDAPGDDHCGHIESNVSQIHDEGGDDCSFGGNLAHEASLVGSSPIRSSRRGRSVSDGYTAPEWSARSMPSALPEPRTLDAGLWTQDPGPWTLDSMRSPMSSRPSAGCGIPTAYSIHRMVSGSISHHDRYGEARRTSLRQT